MSMVSGPTTTTEILDEDSNSWRIGPNLPSANLKSVMLEDAKGRVFIVGGDSTARGIFRLVDAASKWEVLTQKMKIARLYQTAFWVHDSLVDCV